MLAVVCVCVCVCVCVSADMTRPGAELHVWRQADRALAVNSDALWGHFLLALTCAVTSVW